MKLAQNKFLAGLREGKQQIGIWVSLCDSFAAEIVAGAGFDWALIDMEHSPNDIRSALGQLQALAAYSTTAIVRPDWNDAVMVKRLLDIGAPGLLFPMVQNPDEAAAAVAATRYPPAGIRGVSGTTRANGFGRVADYFPRIEDEIAVLVQVETKAAIEMSFDIGRTAGVDGVFFGPADIAADMGLLGQPTSPLVWEVIRPAARRLIEAGVKVGTLVSDVVLAKSLLNEGFTFVACGADTGILARGADALVKTMREA